MSAVTVRSLPQCAAAEPRPPPSPGQREATIRVIEVDVAGTGSP